MIDLKRLRELEARATSGPIASVSDVVKIHVNKGRENVFQGAQYTPSDGEKIIASWNALPELLKIAEAAKTMAETIISLEGTTESMDGQYVVDEDDLSLARSVLGGIEK